MIRTDSRFPTQLVKTIRSGHSEPVDRPHPDLRIHKMSDSRESALKLSLERLYKDDIGRPIPTLFDITPDGRYVFEPCASMILGVTVV
jgi:hypothetical protein